MKNFIIQILEGARSDDLERAQLAFSRLTEKQMDEKWGQSDFTPREILSGYQEYRNKINAAIQWMTDK